MKSAPPLPYEPAEPAARGDQPTFPMAIPGQHFPVLVHLAEGSASPVKIDKISLELEGSDSSAIKPEDSDSGQLEGGGVMNAVFDVKIPENAAYTRPYFDRPGLDQPYYDLRDPQYRNLPFAPYPLQARVLATYQGVQIQLSESRADCGAPGRSGHRLPSDADRPCDLRHDGCRAQGSFRWARQFFL